MSTAFSCLAPPGETPADAPGAVFACDGPDLGNDLAPLAGVVLPAEGEARAAALLDTGAVRVFVGDAALRDAGVVERLVSRFGGERIGVYVPARRMEVGWSFETVSNADFRVVTPSVCEPCWEILRADGSRSGTRVHWWLGEMIKRGVSATLVRVDIRDDADLNVCAGLVEDFGERLWLGPLADPAPALADWVAYGKLARIVLPPALYARREQLLPLAAPGSEPPSIVEAA
jgi:hypothetical protein